VQKGFCEAAKIKSPSFGIQGQKGKPCSPLARPFFFAPLRLRKSGFTTLHGAKKPGSFRRTGLAFLW